MQANSILSLAIWVPIFFGGLLLFSSKLCKPKTAEYLSLFAGMVSFFVTLPIVVNFDLTTAQFQFQEFAHWILPYRINYHLGVDGFSVPLILLTSFMTLVVIISNTRKSIPSSKSKGSIQKNIGLYNGAFLIMSGLMIGVFTSLDAILYYIFWEAMLIPMFLIIGIWGGPNRVYATIKFFLYTVLGSLLMLVAFIYLYMQTGSFSLFDFYKIPLTLNTQFLIFMAFFMAFAVKIPMWPVHTWLPDAHVEAPTGGSIILAAIMLKLGGYSFIRFAMPIATDAAIYLKPFIIGLSLVSIVYIALIALVQKDMKKLIAYSSISHMGFVTLGLFLLTPLGVEGGYIQMISHGFISAALFLCVGILYDQSHTRDIDRYGGVINKMPLFTAFAVFFAMANAGLPGTSGFVGEFLVILASAQSNFWIAFLASLTLLVGAAYSLWMIKRVFYGEVTNKLVDNLKDIGLRETVVLGSLACLVIVVGVYPAIISDITNVTADQFIQSMSFSKVIK